MVPTLFSEMSRDEISEEESSSVEKIILAICLLRWLSQNCKVCKDLKQKKMVTKKTEERKGAYIETRKLIKKRDFDSQMSKHFTDTRFGFSSYEYTSPSSGMK